MLQIKILSVIVTAFAVKSEAGTYGNPFFEGERNKTETRTEKNYYFVTTPKEFESVEEVPPEESLVQVFTRTIVRPASYSFISANAPLRRTPPTAFVPGTPEEMKILSGTESDEESVESQHSYSIGKDIIGPAAPTNFLPIGRKAVLPGNDLFFNDGDFHMMHQTAASNSSTTESSPNFRIVVPDVKSPNSGLYYNRGYADFPEPVLAVPSPSPIQPPITQQASIIGMIPPKSSPRRIPAEPPSKITLKPAEHQKSFPYYSTKTHEVKEEEETYTTFQRKHPRTDTGKPSAQESQALLTKTSHTPLSPRHTGLQDAPMKKKPTVPYIEYYPSNGVKQKEQINKRLNTGSLNGEERERKEVFRKQIQQSSRLAENNIGHSSEPLESHADDSDSDTTESHEEEEGEVPEEKSDQTESASGHGGGGEGHKETGGGSEYEEHNDSKKGEKGEKGYKKGSDHKKASKGHHDKEGHTGEYHEEKGQEKKHKKGEKYYGEHVKEEKGKKGKKYGGDKKHKKGHTTHGEHNIVKKDEYIKTTKFYDEDHDGGEEAEHGEYLGHHAEKQGGKKGEGHHVEKTHKEDFAKKGHHDKGHDEDEKAGFEHDEGHDDSYGHEEEHGSKKGGKKFKKWKN